MTRKRFKKVDRASNLLYWDCPKHCKQLHSMTISAELPVLVSCTCGSEYTITMVTDINATSARILIEGDIK